ncbi:MAG: hypothetical protein ACYSTQ_10095 [Planctomycetota bacterium]
MRWQALGSNGTIPQAVLDRFAYSVSADFLPEAPSSDLQNAIKKTQDFTTSSVSGVLTAGGTCTPTAPVRSAPQ